jgi:hypothetical protein
MECVGGNIAYYLAIYFQQAALASMHSTGLVGKVTPWLVVVFEMLKDWSKLNAPAIVHNFMRLSAPQKIVLFIIFACCVYAEVTRNTTKHDTTGDYTFVSNSTHHE